MYIKEIEQIPKRIDAMLSATNYNDFPTSNDYNFGYKAQPKLKLKDNKLKNMQNNDVTVRKKVKTAGETKPENVFNTTFGSFDKDSYFNNTNDMKKVYPVALNFIENNPFELSYEDTNTPTLPNLDSQLNYREDQSMPKPLPRHTQRKPNMEYNYQASQYKAKSS